MPMMTVSKLQKCVTMETKFPPAANMKSSCFPFSAVDKIGNRCITAYQSKHNESTMCKRSCVYKAISKCLSQRSHFSVACCHEVFTLTMLKHQLVTQAGEETSIF